MARKRVQRMKTGLALARPASGGKRHMLDEATGKTLCGKTITVGLLPNPRVSSITCEPCFARYRALGGSVLTYKPDGKAKPRAERSKARPERTR